MFLGTSYPWWLRAISILLLVVVVVDVTVANGNAMWLVVVLALLFIAGVIYVRRNPPIGRR